MVSTALRCSTPRDDRHRDRDSDDQPFRFPVQWVNRPQPRFPRLCRHGRVRPASRPATTIVVAASGRTIARSAASSPMTATVATRRGRRRGDAHACRRDRRRPRRHAGAADRAARGRRPVRRASDLDGSRTPLVPGRSYICADRHPDRSPAASPRSSTRSTSTPASISPRTTLGLNEIGFCNFVDRRCRSRSIPTRHNRRTGSFIVIDRYTNRTVGAGMIAFALRRATNIHWQPLPIGKTERAALKQQKPCIVWFTGLSGAGKSTIANIVEQKLHRARPPHHAARRRQCPPRPQPRPRLHRGRPRREHPPRRRGREADGRQRADRDLLVHLALPRRARHGARAGRRRRVHRGLRRHADRGMHAARPQGPLCQGARPARSRTSPASTRPTKRPKAPKSA